MGEPAAGPTAKRRISPQLGAVDPVSGSPKMATDPLPASVVPTTQGKARTSATTTACSATDEDRATTAHFALDEERAQDPGHRHDEHHGQHRRREARRRPR